MILAVILCLVLVAVLATVVKSLRTKSRQEVVEKEMMVGELGDKYISDTDSPFKFFNFSLYDKIPTIPEADLSAFDIEEITPLTSFTPKGQVTSVAAAVDKLR